RPSAIATAVAATVTIAAFAAGAVMWSSDQDPAPQSRIRNMVMLSRMRAFSDEVCRCDSKQCVDAVVERLTELTKQMSRVDGDGGGGLSPEATIELSVLSSRVSLCKERVRALESAEIQLVRRGSAEPVITGDPEGGTTKVVQLPRPGVSVHEAALAIAAQCDLNVVVPGRLTSTLRAQLSGLRCDDALKAFVRETGLRYEQRDGHILR